MTILKQQISATLFGLAIGDAVGVPYEFLSRSELLAAPATDMIGFGTHEQPAGTFSDDSSLSFCLAEMLTGEFSIDQLAKNFLSWTYQNYWTARGEVFDIGIATAEAMTRLQKGVEPALAGGAQTEDNGNGSLMRILPLAFFLRDKATEERYRVIEQVSSITHRHNISVIGCFYYLEFAISLINGLDMFAAYKLLQTSVPAYLKIADLPDEDISVYQRLFTADISEIKQDHIQSSGFILHTLEASIWCILKTQNYKDAVLLAVNLGEDTDTTVCVTGGLAGILYGINDIPKSWRDTILRKQDIADLSNRLFDNLK